MPSQADDSGGSECINCGADISSKARFCERCGALQVTSKAGSSEQVGEGAEVRSLSAANLEEELPPAEVANQENAWQVFVRPSHKQVIVVSLAVVSFIAICAALYLGLRMSPKEQFDQGLKYATGQGVQQDDVQAVSWYQKAADRGYAEAQENLGEMYKRAKDDAQAVYWYQKAAQQGYPAAQYNLGDAYAEGQGVQQDDTRAVTWSGKLPTKEMQTHRRDLARCTRTAEAASRKMILRPSFGIRKPLTKETE